MDIIEKIEIKHFRSFDGGKEQEKVKITNLKDLNIFSGANDSGKSNVLRALNLFFNNELSPGVDFDKERDFSKIVASRFEQELKERRKNLIAQFDSADVDGPSSTVVKRSDITVSIKLHFFNPNKQRGLPVKFWISRLYSSKNNFKGAYVYQNSLQGNGQVKLFLDNFKFEYVPAIKDNIYFKHLFQKLQTYLFEKGDKKKENQFSKSSDHFNRALKSETDSLFQQFQISSGVNAAFHVPSTLVDFFRTLSVKTENDISLFDRGDGVQARFIPEILDEISKNTKKNVIWGFEEPENSYEAKNIRKIRDEFLYKYSRNKQIFITSHTKEFLSLKRDYTKQEISILNNKKYKTKTEKEAALDKLNLNRSSSEVSVYRVWKNLDTNNTSLVTRFDEKNGEWENTCDDLGIVEESRMVELLQEKIEEQDIEIAKSSLSAENQKLANRERNVELKKALANIKDMEDRIAEYEKPILIVEDKLDDIYKIAYLKLNDITFTKSNLSEVFKEKGGFVIRRAEGAGPLAGNLRIANTDGYENKRVVGLFDYDEKGTHAFYMIKDGKDWTEDILGNQEVGYYKKRDKHDCFYALLLPVPKRLKKLTSDVTRGKFLSFVEVENLLPERILIDKKLVRKEEVLDREYLKIKKDAKSKLPRILSELPKKEFKDFMPLFSILSELYAIE